MTNRQWLLEQMQNMSDEELAYNAHDCVCDHSRCKTGRACMECKLEWLKSEHKEPIKLSDAERVILENVDKRYEWIVRAEGGALVFHIDKPYKIEKINVWDSKKGYNDLQLLNHLFQFITWNDSEPYNIEELLKESEKENANKYLTIENIKALYEEMDNNREAGDSYFTKYDGTLIPLDTGYAFEGIKLFIEEIEHKLKGE